MINEETMNQWVLEYKLLSDKRAWHFLKDKGLTKDDSQSISEFLSRVCYMSKKDVDEVFNL